MAGHEGLAEFHSLNFNVFRLLFGRWNSCRGINLNLAFMFMFVLQDLQFSLFHLSAMYTLWLIRYSDIIHLGVVDCDS